MNSLGHKKQNSKSIGNKNYFLNHIGHKVFDKGLKPLNLKATGNGLIENYSNHSNSIYEPIKGVEIKTNKSKFTVEKQKINKSTLQQYD